MDTGHDQASYSLRMEWGPTGAAAIGTGADVAVVVDVLSFTTTLTVALERGITVLPFRWRDARAAEYAAARAALLAVGRFEARDRPGAVSLSPAAMQDVAGVERIVLPSPNGSTICHQLADSGAEVVGACLRNAGAVAAWLAPRLEDGAVCAVVPAGERWPDDSLRPCAEDLWGAGAVIAALLDGSGAASPEARLAARAWLAVQHRVDEELAACAGGRELAAAGFADDAAVAGQVDVSEVVPVLRGEQFVRATASTRP